LSPASEVKLAREDLGHVRPIEVDNSLLPGLRFAPLTSPASLPDPRGCEIKTSPAQGTEARASDPNPRPDSDEALAFSSIRQLEDLLRSRKISSVELACARPRLPAAHRACTTSAAGSSLSAKGRDSRGRRVPRRKQILHRLVAALTGRLLARGRGEGMINVRGQFVAVKRYTFARILFFRSSSFTSFARA
jgi:hypothetical protein